MNETPSDYRDIDLRFRLPDELLDMPEKELEERAWRGAEDDMLRIDGVGAFLRVLFTVSLTEDYSVTFGAWTKVDVEDLRSAWGVWSTDAYADLAISGALANGLPPWEQETLGRPVRAEVTDLNELPYVTGSEDSFLHRLLTTRSQHGEVLEALGRYLRPRDPGAQIT